MEASATAMCDLMRVFLPAMGLRVADDRRADLKAVAVVLDAGAVVVEVEAELAGVALHQKVLPVEVGDVDVLAAAVEAVEAAVGVLFELREVGEVVVVAVVVEAAED